MSRPPDIVYVPWMYVRSKLNTSIFAIFICLAWLRLNASVYRRTERCGLRSLRIADDLVLRADFMDWLVFEQRDPVGDIAREADFKSDANHRHSFPREHAGRVQHLADEHGLECGRHLVKQNVLRRHGKGVV